MNKTFAQCDKCQKVNTTNETGWVAFTYTTPQNATKGAHICPSCAGVTKISDIPAMFEPKPAPDAKPK